MKSKRIFLLLGPKGAGKSFIGTLLQEHFGIRFLCVEDWAKSLQRSRSVDSESYVKEVFETIEQGVRESLRSNNQIVFESTGLTEHFDLMFDRLSTDFALTTIRVKADSDRCLNRVKTRDQEIHVAASDEQVRQINQAVNEMNKPTDFEIENDDKSVPDLLDELREIFNTIKSEPS